MGDGNTIVSQFPTVRTDHETGSASAWSVPTNVRDLTTLEEWLGSLPVPQWDITTRTEVPRTVSWHAFGWGRVVPREMDSPEERHRVERETIIEMAFLLLGFFAAAPEAVVWRRKPEFEWQRDEATGAWVARINTRIGSVLPKEDSGAGIGIRLNTGGRRAHG